jgi:hypothetical protein
MPANAMNNSDRGEIVIYQASEDGPRLDVRLEKETIWLDAHQMADLFERDRTVIVRHIPNVYATGKLVPEATCAKNAQVAALLFGEESQLRGWHKRIAAALFLWFMEKNAMLRRDDGTRRIADNALVAITLLIAVSEPAEKRVIISIVVNLINGRN